MRVLIAFSPGSGHLFPLIRPARGVRTAEHFRPDLVGYAQGATAGPSAAARAGVPAVRKR